MKTSIRSGQKMDQIRPFSSSKERTGSHLSLNPVSCPWPWYHIREGRALSMHPPAYPARPPARSQAAEDCPSVVPAALVLQSEVSQKEKDKYHILMHICEIRKKKWYRRSYWQSRNRDTGVENKHMYIKGKGRGGVNWEIGIGIYAVLVLCVK